MSSDSDESFYITQSSPKKVHHEANKDRNSVDEEPERYIGKFVLSLTVYFVIKL
jgi:hypothetical protein